MTELPDWVRPLHSALDDKLGLELLEVAPERAVGRVPVEGNTQPLGLWHGGASAVLAETLGSMAALAHARTLDRVAVGVDLNVTHHRAVRSGWVTGTATALRLGSTTAMYEVALADDAGQRIGSARLTCAVVAPR
ncbi:PaaI family thioesterase [Desertihabitans brevis]|uniref:PaaI family thioesterase n=1 Tax=Desertihabitans brevis TaxID=2268447 RepID=A0A367YXN2_9ACTN|nr:PaaI family thioesterase [Desertihabitans brevis]RCK70590.1 PaaI family thioesterase [Desertihabitans brevis]